MGSFNVGCGISNTPVSPGEKVAIMIIGRNRMLDYYDEHPGVFYGSSLVHSNTLYRPLFPAIHATYDDYGNFTNIEPSPVNAVIEKHFNAPIADIINAVGDDWEAKEIREKRIDSAPQLASLEEKSLFVYRPEVFTELKDFIHKRSDVFDSIRLGDEKSWEVFTGSLAVDEYGFANPQHTHPNPINEFVENETNYPYGGKEIIHLGVEGMKHPLLDWFYLVKVMEMTNHIFHPTYCGEQHGDWEVTQKLSELTQKVVAQREEWDEDFDEDDEL